MITTLFVVLALGAAGADRQAQGNALRIVVIEGEGAVNIIQQKTAVSPLVEIRDRNNLPVSGATVTFSIGGKSASFAGGAQTLTVTTNAAGRAAAAALNPLGGGSFQIQVSAAFQGQTAAATIAQTNVLTAVEAAAAAQTAGASGAGGSGSGATAGGAAGGGGGLSATTIGILGAAVGGGALAATQVDGLLGGGGKTYTGDYAGQLLVAVGSNCISTRAVGGKVTLQLEVKDATVSG